MAQNKQCQTVEGMGVQLEFIDFTTTTSGKTVGMPNLVPYVQISEKRFVMWFCHYGKYADTPTHDRDTVEAAQSTVWPGGNYALPMSFSYGCPGRFQKRKKWIETKRTVGRIHSLTKGADIGYTRYATKNGTIDICETASDESFHATNHHNAEWPAGSYCILNGSTFGCPRGFNNDHYPGPRNMFTMLRWSDKKTLTTTATATETVT